VGKGSNKWGRDQRGASLVETALVMGILILLAIGVGDLGRAFHGYIVITNAAREGARYASHFPADQDGIENVTIQEALGSQVQLAADNIEILGLGGAGGAPIRVTVTYSLTTILGGAIGMPDLTLRNGAEMVVFGVGS